MPNKSNKFHCFMQSSTLRADDPTFQNSQELCSKQVVTQTVMSRLSMELTRNKINRVLHSSPLDSKTGHALVRCSSQHCSSVYQGGHAVWQLIDLCTVYAYMIHCVHDRSFLMLCADMGMGVYGSTPWRSPPEISTWTFPIVYANVCLILTHFSSILVKNAPH